MSEFINTIDLLGDEVVANALVARTITEFNDDVINTVGHYAFYKCQKLTSVDLPNATSIGQSAFNTCSALARVNMPNVTSIGESAFSACSALASVNLPNVTSIGQSAFNACSALASVNLPNVTSIAASVFARCRALTIVILRSKTLCTLAYTGAFSNTPFASGGTGGTLLVPRAIVTEYPNATNWSVVIAWNPNNRILALEDYTIDGTITGEIDWDKLGGTT